MDREHWENGNRKSLGQQLEDLETEMLKDQDREILFSFKHPSSRDEHLFQRLMRKRAQSRVNRKREIRKSLWEMEKAIWARFQEKVKVNR